MNCCVDCFKDEYIKKEILQKQVFGYCDFCSSKDVNVYDISTEENKLSELFTSILQLYEKSSIESAKKLKLCLRDDWDIFNLGTESISILLQNLCPDFFSINRDIINETVIISQLTDIDYLKEFGVVQEKTWSKFAESIKIENRYHSKMFNPDIFASFISVVCEVYNPGKQFYRARICNSKDGYEKIKMGAPPKGKSSPGRINPEGISVLYIASDERTVLNEVRATTYDYVTIGNFKPKREIKVVNLTKISRTSPFVYSTEIEKYCVNRGTFKEMAIDFAKPLRRNDSQLEYLPTQYIAEFIKSEGYDGVQYDSTLCEGGFNIAIFDPNLFECTDTKTVEISKTLYKTVPELL